MKVLTLLYLTYLLVKKELDLTTPSTLFQLSTFSLLLKANQLFLSECESLLNYVFQKDELSLFKDKYRVINKENVVSYMKVADEYRNFHVDVSEFGVTAYRVKIDAGITVIQDCVHVTSDLHVILSFESSPIPLPDYISTSAGCKLTSLDMPTNLSNTVEMRHTTTISK